ncbi:type II toxin-antitoxin system Phd/YefM family antitoxin [Sphingobium boeckii]|uniref:Antitoxin n=1 Tax=Sphingobium boeckii TaxID=1082345 RepID=A0A7W9AF22_9SPHN|nr:type II toxin-antitoxin system Phd/YefM family antitoxin [Sphingobium boeckii]MBB5684490.1 prevent-host-death family protein [Sphingobium boeckii]
MSASVNVHDAKTNFSKLLERAHAGEEIILAKAGKPYAKLVPIEPKEPKPRRTPGGWPELRNIPASVWFDPLPDDELDAWEGKYSNIL